VQIVNDKTPTAERIASEMGVRAATLYRYPFGARALKKARENSGFFNEREGKAMDGDGTSPDLATGSSMARQFIDEGLSVRRTRERDNAHNQSAYRKRKKAGKRNMTLAWTHGPTESDHILSSFRSELFDLNRKLIEGKPITDRQIAALKAEPGLGSTSLATVRRVSKGRFEWNALRGNLLSGTENTEDKAKGAALRSFNDGASHLTRGSFSESASLRSLGPAFRRFSRSRPQKDL
jgi:hypothetical protein